MKAYNEIYQVNQFTVLNITILKNQKFDRRITSTSFDMSFNKERF